MSVTPVIQFKKLNPKKDQDIPLPQYMTPQSAGMDIAIAIEADITLNPGEIKLMPTGFAMAIPNGFEAQIRPRSGLAIKHGIGIINAPGTIDADYRGEVKIGLINYSNEPHTLSRGDRVAQMIISKVWQADISEVNELDETLRNDGGFGHTGK